MGLRNFFARRREQRVRPGEGRREGGEEKVRKSVRIVRPQLVKERKEESGQEEKEVTREKSGTAVASADKKQEQSEKKPEKKTTRKRFRLIKNPGVNQDKLLEKLLANIDLKNDIVTESKFIRRPSRFRPSLNRAQIRKKAETALKPKLRNSRIRIRKPNTTTEKTIVTTVQRKEQEQEVEATTQAIVLSEQSSEEIIKEQQTAVTEVYEDVTEA